MAEPNLREQLLAQEPMPAELKARLAGLVARPRLSASARLGWQVTVALAAGSILAVSARLISGGGQPTTVGGGAELLWLYTAFLVELGMVAASLYVLRRGAVAIGRLGPLLAGLNVAFLSLMIGLMVKAVGEGLSDSHTPSPAVLYTVAAAAGLVTLALVTIPGAIVQRAARQHARILDLEQRVRELEAWQAGEQNGGAGD
jgi:hypothetical protein